ncbi:MAG: hypothetical protein HYW65_00190 [Candidatus Liptonbacteria bacterium]|nr:hypothetical protein [Candidatus Liptonbacteria bacterium]
MDSSRTHYAVAVAVVVIVAVIAWWFVSSYGGAPAPATPSTPVAQPATPAAAVTTSSLGASILEKAQNPLQGKVQEISPTANPVKNVYKNPFE